MTDANIDIEITRLTDLRNSQKETLDTKLSVYHFLNYLNGGDGDEEHKDKLDLVKNYYNASDKFLETKILFFTHYKQQAFPEKFIDRMNEHMGEQITSAWAYLGMEEHEEERKGALSEFEFFKTIINRFPVIKKKTRRSGKKHRK